MPESEERLFYPSDDDRAWMQRRMDETGISVQQLADAVHTSRQSIYQIRDGITKGTTLWPAIVGTLGGFPPSGAPIVLDERLRKIVNDWSTLPEDDRQLVEQLMDRLVAKKP